jgi:hypothetical protein
VSILSDAKNCGDCGVACDAGDICERGVCTLDCPGEQLACSDMCVDITRSAQHCGRCDNACGGTQACQRGRCRCTDMMLTACGTECVDTDSNPMFCGDCRTACMPGQTCEAGMCMGEPTTSDAGMAP